MALTILAAYDISEDGPRARVAAVLQQWGTRLQHSVFICTIDEPDLTEVIERVRSLMNLKTDSFLVLRQCADCWSNMAVIGQASPRPDTLYWAVM